MQVRKHDRALKLYRNRPDMLSQLLEARALKKRNKQEKLSKSRGSHPLPASIVNTNSASSVVILEQLSENASQLAISEKIVDEITKKLSDTSANNEEAKYEDLADDWVPIEHAEVEGAIDHANVTASLTGDDSTITRSNRTLLFPLPGAEPNDSLSAGNMVGRLKFW